MSGGGFSADPEALSHLAAGFERAAEQLGQEIAAFRSATRDHHPGMFGALPVAQDAHFAYMRRLEEAVSGLSAVRDTFETDLAAGIRAVAGRYAAADDASSVGHA